MRIRYLPLSLPSYLLLAHTQSNSPVYPYPPTYMHGLSLSYLLTESNYLSTYLPIYLRYLPTYLSPTIYLPTYLPIYVSTYILTPFHSKF